jgi:hypothetical protein
VADRPLKLRQSSQIHKGSTYDDETGRLTAVLNGGVYSYHDVPPEKIEGLEKAPSHGDYFHKHIRGQHEFNRVK